MNLSSGYPYSLIRNGIPYDYPKLCKHINTDVVILGGGISGALAAYYLLAAGVTCVLVDSRTFGLGSSCASTSLLQYEIDTPLSKLTKQIGDEKARRAYYLSGKSIGDLEEVTKKIGYTDFSYKKSVYFAGVEKDLGLLEKELLARKQCGFAVKWMDKKALQNKYGLAAPAAIVSALGAETNAYTLTHALHQYNHKKGMQIYDRTAVVKIDHHTKGVKLLTAEGYRISGKKLVYATGYESVKYIDQKIVDLSVTYATVSEQFEDRKDWKNRPIFWSTGDPYLYTRSTGDHRLLVGGRDDRFSSTKKSDEAIKRKGALLKKDFQKIFPGTSFTNEFSWAGVFGSTKDGLPYIGNYHKLPNSLFALGFGGNGITFSVLAAQLIRDSITGHPNKDLALFSFDR